MKKICLYVLCIICIFTWNPGKAETMLLAAETVTDSDHTSGGGVMYDQYFVTIIQASKFQITEAIRKFNEIGVAGEASSEKTAEKAKKFVSIFEETRNNLEELRARALQIPGMETHAKTACEHYFDMQVDVMNSLCSLYTFCSEYFYLGLYEDIPVFSDYHSKIADYNQDLYAWYNRKKEIIDSIKDVPSSLDIEWGKYKKSFEMNLDICKKDYFAVEYDDYLRHASAQNLASRYLMEEEKGFNAFMNAMGANIDFTLSVRDWAELLADELINYTNLSKEERNAYVFQNDQYSRILLDYEPIGEIYPSLYNIYDAFLIINTGCLCGTRDIVIEAEIPGFTQPMKQSYRLNSTYRKIYLKPPVLAGDIDLTSAKDAQIQLSIYEKNGIDLIDAQSFPVRIMSRNDFVWQDDEFGIFTKDNILCFVTPEAPAIAGLKRVATDEIKAMTDGAMESFPGYQKLGDGYLSNPFVITYLQAAGIMRALNSLGIRYVNDAFSLNSHQHILLPSEVLEKKSGLCIETTLVVASALQSAGLHCFLVFPPGHAQVAVEIWEGSGQYFLIETTAVDDGNNSRGIFINNANKLIDKKRPDGPIYYYSAEDWKKMLTQTDADGNLLYYIVDCDDSGILGRTPFAN